MNSQQRMLAVLSGGAPDLAPVAPCYPDLYLYRFQCRAYLDAYQASMNGRSEIRLCPDEDNQILVQSRVKALEAWKEPPDWLEVRAGPSAETQARSRLQVRSGQFFLIDACEETELNLSVLAAGGTNELLKDSVAQLHRTPPTSSEEIHRRIPVKSKEQILASGVLDVAKAMADRFRDETFIHCIVGTPYARAKYVTGFFELLVMMKRERALLHTILERQLQAQLALLEAWAAVGVHGVWLEETLSSADLISPECYDEFVFEGTREMVQHCQALGMKAILYPCGNIMPRLGRLVEMAPDALAVEESKKNFVLDIGAIRRAVGPSLSLFGNVDAYNILERAGNRELDAEIRRQLRDACAGQGRFIQGIGSPITPGTPPSRVGHFIRRCRALGRESMSWNPD